MALNSFSKGLVGASLALGAMTSTVNATPVSTQSSITRTMPPKSFGADQAGDHFGGITGDGSVKVAVLAGNANEFSSVSGLLKLQYGSDPTSNYGMIARLDPEKATLAFHGLGNHVASAMLVGNDPEAIGLGRPSFQAPEAPYQQSAAKVTFGTVQLQAAPAAPAGTA